MHGKNKQLEYHSRYRITNGKLFSVTTTWQNENKQRSPARVHIYEKSMQLLPNVVTNATILFGKHHKKPVPSFFPIR